VTENPEPETTGQTPPAAPAEPNAVDDREAVSRVEEVEPLARAEESEDQPRRQLNHWWRRPTIRALKREAQERGDYLDQQDERDNAATRLPAGESVHLGGLVLAEAFSPSTVSALYDTIRRWSGSNNRRRDEWVAELDRSRSGRSGGWSNLGVVRRPGDNIFAIFDDGVEDSRLPDSVMAVWLHLSYLMPSIAVVAATFTFRDEAADVSSVLRRDYHTQFSDSRIRVYGKFGRLRAWLPWSRPKNHGMTFNVSRAEDEKRRAFEQVIHEREAECSRWFISRFPGRFALADSAARPVARLIFTEKEVPFKDRSDWFRPIGLGWSPTIYRSVEIPGWALKEGQWPYARGRFVLTFAVRRRDAAREPAPGESGEQNWDLTQRFNLEQAPLVARYATHALLSLYGERLAELRDGARARHRPRRTVRDALALDDYLTTDGLDAATITADVGALTKDLRRFRWDLPEYTEDQEGLPDTVRRRRASPLEFVPALCSSLKEQAARLATDTENTVENIRSSAELKQAIANTRLQRMVIVVSLAALIAAVVRIFLAG